MPGRVDDIQLIKRQFKKLGKLVMGVITGHCLTRSTVALKTHPDKGGDQAEFNVINNARIILTDPIKKAEYDSRRVHMPQPASAHSTPRGLDSFYPPPEVLPLVSFIVTKDNPWAAARQHVYSFYERVARTQEAAGLNWGIKMTISDDETSFLPRQAP